jgi:aspartate/methionine/tyrosine aminotransferase
MHRPKGSTWPVEPNDGCPNVRRLAESATLGPRAAGQQGLQARARRRRVGAGEPNFPHAEHIVEAAVAACRDPRNTATPRPGGLPELKEAIAFKTSADSGFDCTAAQVLGTNGGKHAVYTAFARCAIPVTR